VEFYSIDVWGNAEAVTNQTHYVDETPPVTTKEYGIPSYSDGGDEWITTSTTIYLNTTDVGVHPVGGFEIMYRLWNMTMGWSTWQSSGANITSVSFSVDGGYLHYIEFFAVDKLGNVESVQNQTVFVDETPPRTKIRKDYYPGNWSIWHLDATDGGVIPCGVREVWYYSIPHHTWVSTPGDHAVIDIPGDGEYTIEYYSIDNLGNTEPLQTTNITVKSPEPYNFSLPDPEVLITFIGFHEWFDTHWMIHHETLICFDVDSARAFGISEIHYKLNDGEWMVFEDCFSLPVGTYSLYYYGVDRFGMHTPTARIIIEVVSSNAAPFTTITVNPYQPDGLDGWYTTIPTLFLDAFDENDDETTIYYRVDNDRWLEYTGSFIVGDGVHVVEFYSVDEHGTTETLQSRTIKVDIYAPEITLEKPKNMVYLFDREIIPTNHRPIIIGKLTLKASVSDPHTSGVDTTTLQIDNTVVATFDDTIEYELDEPMIGEHTIKITATDIAGNKATKTIQAWIFNF
jgi:hypothetical protein